MSHLLTQPKDTEPSLQRQFGDVKWQSLKVLVREAVGEVTYMELFMDTEGRSGGKAVVGFKMEESMNKAGEMLSKPRLHGRPLKAKEVPEDDYARKAMTRLEGLETQHVQQLWNMKLEAKIEGSRMAGGGTLSRSHWRVE